MGNNFIAMAGIVLGVGILGACGQTAEQTQGSGQAGPGSTAASGGGDGGSAGSQGTGGGMAGNGGSQGQGGGLGGSGGSQGQGGGLGGAGGGTCTPKTNNTGAINMNCMQSMNCPAGYTCQHFIGIQETYSCQILCDADCECPMGLTCQTVSDKMFTWTQCMP